MAVTDFYETYAPWTTFCKELHQLNENLMNDFIADFRSHEVFLFYFVTLENSHCGDKIRKK
jgi:hypothetical protein